jgi:DNA mismatch endonuclease (patch repair protein)
MPDQFSRSERSEIMRRVKGRDTSLERKVRSALHKRGLRYRLYYELPGKPDIAFVRARVVVFIDSCFWHGCPQHLRMPASNRDYWEKKINKNIERDMKNNKYYENSGWTLIRLWEHELKVDFSGCIDRISETVRSL